MATSRQKSRRGEFSPFSQASTSVDTLFPRFTQNSDSWEISLVLPFINTVTFADGACEARSRREEESMQGHRRRRKTKRSPATPIRPKGWGGTGPSFCCFSSPMSLHRLVVAPRLRLRRAPNKRYRIYESEYLVRSISNITLVGSKGCQRMVAIRLIESTRKPCLKSG